MKTLKLQFRSGLCSFLDANHLEWRVIYDVIYVKVPTSWKEDAIFQLAINFTQSVYC